jgi:fimbrial isopeptide formation D2 family protein
MAYQVTSSVPDTTGYDTYTFTVHDAMSDGLTFDNDVTVTIAGTTIPATDYTVTSPAADGDTFDVAFNTDLFIAPMAFNVGDPIVVSYTATVNGNAVINSTGNPNTATLEYSNNPYTTTDNTTKYPVPPATTYVYDVNVAKTDNSGNPLIGAQFMLFPASAQTSANNVAASDANNPPAAADLANALTFTQGADTTNSDSNTVSNYLLDAAGSATTQVSADGLLDLQGLAAGTYYLVETQSPDGFNKLTNPVEITITGNTDSTTGDLDGTYTIAASLNGTDCTSASNGVNVINNAGTIFPGTGGMGRTMFLILGPSVVVLAGLIWFVGSKKRKANASKAQ